MNLGIRAVLHTARKWKKTLLLFCLLLSIATLVLSGLAIADAQEEQAEELRGTTGASFTVSRNTATGGWSSSGGGSYSTQEFLSDDMLDKIAQTDGIKGYNATITTILSLYGEDHRYLENTTPRGIEYVDSQYYSYGCVDSQYSSLFLSNTLSLVDGRQITMDDKDVILVSKDLAEKHNLKTGDKIQAVNDPNANDPAKNVEIVGIFDVVADKTDEKNNYNMSSYYDYSNYAFISMGTMKELLVNYEDSKESDSADFFVSDPQKLEQIIQAVQKIDSINWDNFIVTANDDVYERISSTVSDTGTLITTLIVLITVVSMVLMILILSMSVRSRKKELGILLAVGIAKPAVILQYAIETLLIGVFAFPLAYLASKQAAGTLGTLFGRTAENVIVTPQHFALAASLGTILLLVAVLVSCISAMRLKPKEILSQME